MIEAFINFVRKILLELFGKTNEAAITIGRFCVAQQQIMNAANHSKEKERVAIQMLASAFSKLSPKTANVDILSMFFNHNGNYSFNQENSTEDTSEEIITICRKQLTQPQPGSIERRFMVFCKHVLDCGRIAIERDCSQLDSFHKLELFVSHVTSSYLKGLTTEQKCIFSITGAFYSLYPKCPANSIRELFLKSRNHNLKTQTQDRVEKKQIPDNWRHMQHMNMNEQRRQEVRNYESNDVCTIPHWKDGIESQFRETKSEKEKERSEQLKKGRFRDIRRREERQKEFQNRRRNKRKNVEIENENENFEKNSTAETNVGGVEIIKNERIEFKFLNEDVLSKTIYTKVAEFTNRELVIEEDVAQLLSGATEIIINILIIRALQFADRRRGSLTKVAELLKMGPHFLGNTDIDLIPSQFIKTAIDTQERNEIEREAKVRPKKILIIENQRRAISEIVKRRQRHIKQRFDVKTTLPDINSVIFKKNVKCINKIISFIPQEGIKSTDCEEKEFSNILLDDFLEVIISPFHFVRPSFKYKWLNRFV